MVVGIADWLVHREMGCDWLVANMKRFEKIRIYFNDILNAYNMHIYYMDKGILLGTKTLVLIIRHYIRELSGVFSVCHA
jgi:hypothetical protein